MGKNSKKRRHGGGGGEIVFDPEARKEYLQGFSKRKQERRAYGLAMQKVKDRKMRLEQRAELKQAEKEQVEQAEQQKRAQLEACILDHSVLTGDGRVTEDKVLDETATENAMENDDNDTGVDKVETYEDEQTRSQWGGQVIVTTSTHIPGTSDDEQDDPRSQPAKKRRKVDAEQEYAGNVEKYLNEIKTKMPAKRKKDLNKKHKGVHGASNMKGISGAGDIKIAKRALDRFQSKQKGGKGGHQPSSSNNRRKRH